MEESKEVVVSNEIISMEDVLKVVVKEKDFATIKDSIEITRDFALKLFKLGTLSYDADVEEVTNDGEYKVFIIKATVSKGMQSAVGFGACSTEETQQSGSRGIHDALARAETRAYKRALEMIIGLPFINDVIQKLFGTFQKQSKREPVKTKEYIAYEEQIMLDIGNKHFTGEIYYKNQPYQLDDMRLEINAYLSKKIHSIDEMRGGADRVAEMLLIAEERDAEDSEPPFDIRPEDQGKLDDSELFDKTTVKTEGNLSE